MVLLRFWENLSLQTEMAKLSAPPSRKPIISAVAEDQKTSLFATEHIRAFIFFRNNLVMKKTIGLTRVHDFHSKEPGIYAILVDRLWPRGIRKENLPIDLWGKDWAPSPGLRQLFHDGKIDFSKFRLSYSEELQDKKQEIQEFLSKLSLPKVLLLFASKDLRENNALVLKEVIEGWLADDRDKHQKTTEDRRS